jgi:cytochrome P450
MLLLIALSLSYAGALVIYRLFFHPLHKYPGPTLAALTEGYEAYYNLIKQGGLVKEIAKLHRVYGPVVRIGPNVLHFNNRQAYHDIYTNGTTLTKDPGFYRTGGAYQIQSSIVVCDAQEAKTRRSILGQAFSRRAVIALEYTIQQNVDKLLSSLKENNNSPESSVDMSLAYRSITTDVITSYSFAENSNTLDVPNFVHPLIRDVEETAKINWISRHFPVLIHLMKPCPPKLVAWIFPKFRGFLDLKITLDSQVDRILKNPESLASVDHETVYHHLLVPKLSIRERLSRTALKDEACLLVQAGSDTVGNTAHIGTFYVLKDKRIHDKLVEELCKAWPDKELPMSYEVLEKLPYMTAFIKESLRFSYGAIHPTPRVVHHNTPEIGGLKLPPGTVVEMSSYFMLMNPDVFTDPHVFNPDRWLAEDINEIMHDLVSFGKGPRICLGQNLAWCELYLIFGNLFRKLDLTLLVSEDTIDEFNLDNLMDYFTPQWRKSYRVYIQQLQA